MNQSTPPTSDAIAPSDSALAKAFRERFLAVDGMNIRAACELQRIHSDAKDIDGANALRKVYEPDEYEDAFKGREPIAGYKFPLEENRALRNLSVARALCHSIWEKHFQEDAPDFKVSGDLEACLHQISNMVSDLTRAREIAAQPGEGEFVLVRRDLLTKVLMNIDPLPVEIDGQTKIFVNPMAARVLQIVSAAVREMIATAAPTPPHVADALDGVRLAAERDALRAFAQDVMEDWWEGDLDGGSRQDMAEKHGLIAGSEVSEACGEYCRCAEYGDFPQACYRRTELLTGPIAARAEAGGSDHG